LLCDFAAQTFVNFYSSQHSHILRLGNLGDLSKAGSLHEYLTLLHNQYGPIVKFHYFEHCVVSLASPDLFKETSKLFNRPIPLFALFKPLIGDHSIQYANDEDGKNRRKLLDPYFSHVGTKAVFPVFIEAASVCINRWEKETREKGTRTISVDVPKDMNDVAVFAIILSAFGDEISEATRTAFVESYNICFGEMEASIKGPPIEPGSQREAIFLQHRDKMLNLVHTIIDKHPSGENLDNKGRGGFASFLIEQRFPPEQIISDSITFLVGGFHTTANFLIWALYFLAKYPEHQSRVHVEVDEVLKGSTVSLNDISALPFTTAFLNETLRYVAIAPFAARYSDSDEIIGGYAIPKKTMMIQALGATLQSEKFWPASKKFNPSRFYEDLAASSLWSFKPFGVGNRLCPAHKYAMVETTAILVSLVQEFEFRLLPDQKEISADYGLVAQVKDDLKLLITKRE